MLAYALGGSRLAWLIGLSLLAVATHALAAVMGLRLLPVPQVSGSPAGMVALLVALAAELVLWLLAMKLAVEALRHGAAGHGVDAADAVVEDGVALRHLVLWLALAVAGFLAWRLAGRAGRGGAASRGTSQTTASIAAIIHGIRGRVVRGTAASAHAKAMSERVEPLADLAWHQALKAQGKA